MGGAQAGESVWPMFRHDLKHTGRTPFTGPATPELSWTFTANDGIVSSPTIGSDGTIYVGAGWHYLGGSDSSLYAINPDGSLKWSYKTGDQLFPGGGGGVYSSPAIGPDGTIYFGSIDKYLYAVEDSGSYGKLKWKTYIGYFTIGSPAIGADGTIYIGNSSFNFYAINPDGTQKWRYKTEWCIISSPAIIEDGTIYIGSKDHHLYAFDESLQGPRWRFSTGYFHQGHLLDASPAIGEDGTIYIGSDQYGAAGLPGFPVDTSFWAVNPDGSMKWAFETDDGVESSPALGSDGTVYFGSYDSSLYAVTDNGFEGILKWKFKTNGPIDGSPTIDGDGIIYFGSRDSTLYALYPNGELKWSYKTQGDIESSPTIDGNGYLYFGDFSGILYCLGTGAPDVGVVAAGYPRLIYTDELYTPEGTIQNFRSTPQSFEIACTIDTNGIEIYTDTVSVTDMPGGEIRQQTFSPWNVGLEANSVYNIKVSTILAADDNEENNFALASGLTVGQAYTCGDANGDETINLGDATFIINYVFNDGTSPQPIQKADANCDGTVNLGDAGYYVSYIFFDGPEPCADCPL